VVRRRWLAGVAVGVVVLASAAVIVGVGGQGGSTSSGIAVGPAIGTSESGRSAGSSGSLSPQLAAPDGSGDAATGEAAPPLGDPGALGRDVVRTAHLTVEVADLAAAGGRIRTAVTAAGGFVAGESSDPTGTRLTLRVPVDRLDAVTDGIGRFGTATERSSTTEDATARVADIDGRVAAQQASVTRVRILLDRARTVGEIVSIESELARREADLESLQRRQAVLRDQTALSTVEVWLRPAAAAAEKPGEPTGFLGGLALGWSGLRTIGLHLAAAAGFLLPLTPVLAVLAGLGFLGRRVVRNHRARAAASAADPG
jgi:hypothetical protein